MQGTPQSTTRTGKDFYRELSYTNTSAAVSDTATITGTRSGPPVQTSIEQRLLFLPQTPESFDYDDDGNLTEDGRWIYTWDAENRLIAMETKTSIVTAFPGLKQKLEFAYDSQGRRIRKQVQIWDTALNSGAGDWATVTDLRFVYDGWNLLMELDALNANAVVRSYAWGLDLSGTLQGAGGVGGLLWANTTTHSFAASADGNGNIVAWVNTASLAFAGRADYGAFGEPVMRTGMAKALPFGFSSKYTDAETDLVYYGFRYYNPSTGSWPNRDPIEEKGGLNLYGMVDNDPLNKWDWLGLAPGSEYDTLEAAEKAASSDVWNETNKTIPLGEKEAKEKVRLPFYVGTFYIGEYYAFGRNRNGYYWIYGIEHAAMIYCFKKDGKTIFSYGELAQGAIPSEEKIKRGTTGTVSIDKAQNIHRNHMAYAESVVWHTGVHSHNIQEGPFNDPGDEFSQADKDWANERQLALILVADSGEIRKYSPGKGSPKNGVKIGNVCECK